MDEHTERLEQSIRDLDAQNNDLRRAAEELKEKVTRLRLSNDEKDSEIEDLKSQNNYFLGKVEAYEAVLKVLHVSTFTATT